MSIDVLNDASDIVTQTYSSSTKLHLSYGRTSLFAVARHIFSMCQILSATNWFDLNKLNLNEWDSFINQQCGLVHIVCERWHWPFTSYKPHSDSPPKCGHDVFYAFYWCSVRYGWKTVFVLQILCFNKCLLAVRLAIDSLKCHQTIMALRVQCTQFIFSVLLLIKTNDR